ncbi:MAG: hypothetical protein AzoDbin1_02155 [Azoarcus sp.]|nr:hypothetical protein [Azoarcus sp.]
MKLKPWNAVALADDGRSATITVRGKIGDWWEGKTDTQIDAELNAIGAVNEIVLRINSFGGKLEHGLAMHNALKRHPARVVAIVEGVAASAASVAAMAGDEIRMYANSTMMVHGVTLLDEEGNAVEDADAARALDACMIETYCARTGKTPEDVAAMMHKETWMTAREAVAAGFADQVIEIGGPEAHAARSTSVLAAVADALEIPVDVLERAQAEATASADSETSEGGGPSGAAPAGAEASATFAAQVNALAVASGLGDFVAAWLLDGGIATPEQARAAIAEAREVRDLCAFADAADKAPGFIRSRKSLADVRAELINARAAAADALHTDGHSSIRKPPVAAAPAAVKTADIWALRRKS